AFSAGVKVAFGTDAGTFPHGLNAGEFQYLVEYGLTPMQAIQCATVNAANLLGQADKFGSIEAGKAADIIAVKADPLIDVNVLKKVAFVMKEGVVYKDELTSERGDFLTANMDPSVAPGDDFFEYANGGWLKRNPIPASESAWGIGKVVQEELYTNLRKINERAVASASPLGTEQRKIGDFWLTAMDVAKADQLGVRPLQGELE